MSTPLSASGAGATGGAVACPALSRPCLARRQAGLTILEVLITLAILGLLLTIAGAATLEGARHEKVRGAVQEVRTLLARARIEAVKRNAPCQFALEPVSGTMQVIDTRGTSATTDDVVIASGRLPSQVALGTPDASTPVTLQASALGVYFAEFAQTGAVTGAGQVALRCGNACARVTVYTGGAMRAERWSGGAWRIE